ncbi:low specificity L-threonine aldolase [Geobacillus sp. LEMMY01]|uniref:threonine aldolase family protein n=1 Tax=Geobacillus sp. LEMMY01 TaxID=1954237 RepID=UPI0009AE6F75|nr:GntG family PLP-dependent aldolase [Geobacillus sp. LEMMY01]OPX03048.1 threonine aldolase [Geobacillus sp. LEMMY01]
MIDLRSDTLTLPTEEMRNVIANALVGDDCYVEDSSVIELEEYCKQLFHVEDALFVPTGTMANQLAIKSQVTEGNEVITETNYHINFYESASIAMLSRVVLHTCRTADGILRVEHVEELIHSKPRGPFYAHPQLVSIENTINYYQGKIFPLKVIEQLYGFTREKNISLHMDGARLFNAHVATNIPLRDYAKFVDSLSVCFAKGLGAPFGSMLMGRKEVISKARIYRKQFGAGFHQIGMYAAAALYALKHHISHLRTDHLLTKKLAMMLSKIDGLYVDPRAVETNMIFFHVNNFHISSFEFVDRCKKKGLLLFPWLSDEVRIVVSRNVNEKDIDEAANIIEAVCKELTRGVMYVS